MVRCDDFYKKWQNAGNFCEKHPDTAERIDAYLDMLPYIKEKTANSEILTDPSRPMGAIITERASRPLISLVNSEIRQRAIQQIVNIAESKKMNGDDKPVVTTKEVEQVISELNGTTKPNTSKERYISLAEFKRRQETSREMVYRIVEIDDPSIIPNMIKTEVAIIKKLRDLKMENLAVGV
jgi:hypothetical protein